jgi:23S rRNA pseudouridine2457 synthase
MILFYKPYGVLCQFTHGEGKKTLADFGPFPRDVYPAGRLDADSEGLVLLTNDGKLKHLLMEPKFAHPRTYCAQVERIPSEENLQRLRDGVVIEGRKTLPAEVRLLRSEIPNQEKSEFRSANVEYKSAEELSLTLDPTITFLRSLPPRNPPIRFRKNVPTAWLEITLREGRNRQVRKMTAAVGHPTLRLVRTKILDLDLQGLKPGEHRVFNATEILKLRKALM